jgi:Flp pilus assembly protein TadG
MSRRTPLFLGCAGGARRASRRFAADRRATMSVEFAMISVPLIGLIAAIFEVGLVYLKAQQLQNVVQNASRSVLTSSIGNMTYQNFIDNHVCTWQSKGSVSPGTLDRSFDCSKLLVDVSSPASWSGASLSNSFYLSPNAPGATITMPAAGSIAVVRVVYPMPMVTAILTGGILKGMTLGNGKTTSGWLTSYNGVWSHMLLGVAAFRVEPASS